MFFNSTNKDNKNFSFYKGLNFSFNEIGSNFKNFTKLAGVFAVLNSFIILLASIITLIVNNRDDGGNLVVDITIASVSLFFILVLIGIYCQRWYLLSIGQVSFNEVIKYRDKNKDIKSILFIFGFVVLYSIIGFCFYELKSRVFTATSNLNREVVFFVFHSFIILFSLFLLMNFVVYYKFLNGEKWFVFEKTFLLIFDNIYKLSAWFIVYLLILALSLSLLHNLMNYVSFLPSVISGGMFIIGLNFVLYFNMTLYISLLKYQNNCLLSVDNDIKTEK